ncbi:hypothetical protein TNCV_4576441 [Trichonephila clavipes]|nr:hypothetical protein TNCV_4576441 [Trichonephila clavipes]
MNGVKKTLIGSQKRKIRKEKEYNINSKYAKLDNFLISASSSSCTSASSSNARELDEQGQAHSGIHKRRICHRAASPLVWLVEKEERWEASDHPQSVLPLNWVGPSQIILSPVWCSKLRLTTGVT